MFTEKELIVNEIAQLMGYINTSKFSTTFKNQYEISPSDLIKKQKENTVLQ